jgi:SAM-dependent methyltransferase
LEDVGLNEGMEILSVGSGHEEVLYWLSNRAGRVVATDIYGEGEFADREAGARMLWDPSAYAPYAYRNDRLEVLKMDGRELEFSDGSFDAVFSLSSIEHFGSLREISRAATEIGRVLRPGGHAFVVTECFISRGPVDSRLVQTCVRIATMGGAWAKAAPRRRIVDVLTRGELERWIVRASKLRLVQNFDDAVSDGTWENVIVLRGGREDATEEHRFPHILLRADVSLGPLKLYTGVWTSAAIPLTKPSAEAPATQT